MQSTSNTKAFIHKEQYGGKKKMKHGEKKKTRVRNVKAAPKKGNPGALLDRKKKPTKKLGKPKKQGY